MTGWLAGRLPRIALALAGWLALPCGAEVQLHGIFGDHMVLQRQMPIRIWGTATPGEKVHVQFNGRSAGAAADADGRWQVRLPAQAAGGPYELVVRAANTLRIADVMVGEVWLCAGQSNMEWLLADAAGGTAEVAAANHPAIRHIKIPHATALQPNEDIPSAAWQVSSPATAGQFSAVAYHFAQALWRKHKVPIGLVNVSWGGSHLETWMSREALAAHAELRGLVARMPSSNDAYAAMQRDAMDALVMRWQGAIEPAGAAVGWERASLDDSHWRTLQAPLIWEEQGLEGLDGVLWYRRRVDVPQSAVDSSATLYLGAIDDCDETWLNDVRLGGRCSWDAPREYAIPRGLLKAADNLIAVRVTDTGGGGGFHGEAAVMKLVAGSAIVPLSGAWKARIEAPLVRSTPAMNDLPSLIYHAMLHPLVGMPMRGVIWYQGESNVSRAAQYASAFPLFIRDLRTRWGQGDFPFLYVQLAAFLPLARNSLTGSTWAELREAQRQALSVKNTGMVVATDIGDADDIHPRDKRTVGERLAALALQVNAGGSPVGGPRLREARPRGGQMVLRFDAVGAGLRMHGTALKGFAIADASGVFQAASARIEGRDGVAVWHPDVPWPAFVRFGWVDNPQENNLFSSDGLPASPFRTDWLRWITEGRGFNF